MNGMKRWANMINLSSMNQQTIISQRLISYRRQKMHLNSLIWNCAMTSQNGGKVRRHLTVLIRTGRSSDYFLFGLISLYLNALFNTCAHFEAQLLRFHVDTVFCGFVSSFIVNFTVKKLSVAFQHHCLVCCIYPTPMLNWNPWQTRSWKTHLKSVSNACTWEI